jgi:hypothetical protein
MIAATEIAMPAFHGSDDDFLYQIQHPLADKDPKESRKAADEFLERCLRRLRKPNGFTRPQRQPQSQPQSAGIVGKSYYPEIGRTFHPNPKHYSDEALALWKRGPR